jgi:CRISPR-associated exonuclease Cas4
MIGNVLLPVGLILLLAALILFLLLYNDQRQQRRRLIEERKRALGLPPGDLVYEDAGGQGQPLYSSEYPLLGKPDYVVQLPDGRPVPIELKLNVHDATMPQGNHEVQIAAYCLLLEEYFPETPPTHGILRYDGSEFTVEYTPALRKKVIRSLEQMVRCTEREPPPLARQKITKCRACQFQPICPVGRGK